jgi:hypothetical protein
MDSDIIKALSLLVGFVVAGLTLFGGFSVITVFRKRYESQLKSELPSAELEAIHARLEAAETLERRVAELEERLDFTERMLAQQEPGQLPAGPPTNH